MNTRQCTKLSRRLTQVLGAGTITQLGRTTGFTRRLREVTPHRMAIALLTSLSCHSTQTLADILRVFNALTDRSVRYKPFHNHLAKHAFPTFTWHLVDLLLDHLVLRVLAPLPGHALRRFDDILLQDGSSFAVVDALQDTFPRYCQELWISGPRDQAASFRSPSLFRSFCTPSMKTTPARTNGSR